jgi:hypothetical protein
MKLRRLQKKLNRFQEAQRTFHNDVHFSLKEMRSFVENSQKELHDSQNTQKNETRVLQKILKEEDVELSREEIEFSQEAEKLSQKVKKLSREIKKLSQKNLREIESDLASQQRNSFSQQIVFIAENSQQDRNSRQNHIRQSQNRNSRNMNFIEADSRRNHNASESAYRVAYISK